MHDRLIWHPSHFAVPERTRLNETLPASLSRVAKLWPDRAAVLFGEQVFSYSMLAARAAGLASEIHETADAPGPVAVVLPLGLDSIAAWFACALAGRTLVLLEPDHPPARLKELMAAAGCVLALCDAVTIEAVRSGSLVKTLQSDGRCAELSPHQGLSNNEPCMVFPTSGSTGTPKLVTYAASTLQAKVQCSIGLMRVPECACVVIAGSHGNYGFLHHAMVFLLSGGTLCLADVKSQGLSAVLEAIEQRGARHCRFTPSMFRTLATRPEASQALRQLQAVRFSGEPLLATDLLLAQIVLSSECLIQNVYGSTESALFIWSGDAHSKVKGPTVPLGNIYPMASFAIHAIDQDDPDGSTGELCIRSAFHALGDFSVGGIDSSRFVPFAENSAERVYATGDIVQLLADGNVLHLGRLGRMVKIRGQRVFLSEVENHLRTLPGVTAAAVVEHAENQEPELYGFITTSADADITHDARSQLLKQLPVFMVPRKIWVVAQIPLLSGGKVDYLTLMEHARAAQTAVHSSPAQVTRGLSFRLCQIWDSVLFEGAHRQDADFLSLGGDSLKLMNLSLELEQAFHKALPLEDFLTNSTLCHLADLLDIEYLD